MKKIGVILSILTVLTFGLLPSSGVYADTPADIIFTVTDNSSNFYICGTNSDYSCSGYNYIKLENTSGWTIGSSKYLVVTSSGVGNYVTFNPTLNPIFDLTFGTISDIRINSGCQGGCPASSSITVTLSASPFADCPEPEPCPDCNEPFIVQLFREGFWGVATAIVTIIVPIIALFLVFRLVHDLLWGRG